MRGQPSVNNKMKLQVAKKSFKLISKSNLYKISQIKPILQSQMNTEIIQFEKYTYGKSS